MSKFLDLLQQSVIVQACITLCLVVTVCYLTATGQTVPELLSTALMLVLGFYFGSKVQQQINHHARR